MRVAPFLIALCLGCATWNAQGPTPDAAIRRSDPDLVRIVVVSLALLLGFVVVGTGAMSTQWN